MCGIVGYVGLNEAEPILLDGLAKLEYRGYDSAGIAVHNGQKINIVKSKGKLAELQKKLSQNELNGTLGIGHTRWATHGAPSDINSHPHASNDCKIAVVHNGIIENYLSIKEELTESSFASDTDTEVIAHLINKFYTKAAIENLLDAVYAAIDKMRGTYALAIICSDFPDKLIAVKKDNPLVIGVGKNENFIASDITAIINYTRDAYLLDDDEVALIDAENIKIFDKDKTLVTKKIFKIDWDIESAEKGGYDFFMLKEIFEQPKVINDFLSINLYDENFLHKINLETLENFDRIYIVGCGTAYHASLIGAHLLSKLPNIFVSAEMASEFRYNEPFIDEKTLLIVISQSGETADTLAALRMAKKNNACVLSIVNVVGSSIARESDNVIYITAGPEISVASTKAFSLQVMALYVLVCNLYKVCKVISTEKFLQLQNELQRIPSLITEILDRENEIKIMAEKYLSCKNVFYIGRGLDYFIAREGSLKLKEIAYLYSQAYAAGELKHGPIALIDDSILIVGVITQKNIIEKTLSNLKECKSRHGKIFIVTTENNSDIKNVADDSFIIPQISQMFAPLLANISLQLFAYYIAKGLGYDIDKPRNLAKSVTVE